ncbi:hypothetical protein CKO51_24600 [Rhodopirellula sp. SM50]|nr:protein kinase [Rhodopirellula sp. SM50]PAY16820.1 hypothetical protein CKO51_24600 [Rhodopirellula sp. SM50]
MNRLSQQSVGHISEEKVSSSNRDPADRGRIDPSTSPLIPDYRIDGQVTDEVHATTYQAFHERLRRKVAIKCATGSAAESTLLDQEISLCGRLDHPIVVRALDAGESGGIKYLVREWIDARTLTTILKRHGPLAISDACEVVRRVADGCQHFHEHGLIGCDLNPDNLILCSNGLIKILSVTPPHATDVMKVRDDIQHLGRTFRQLLTSKRPMEGKTRSVSVRSIRPEVPAPVDEVLRRMLDSDSDDGFYRMSDVAEAIAPFCDAADLRRLRETVDRKRGWGTLVRPFLSLPTLTVSISSLLALSVVGVTIGLERSRIPTAESAAIALDPVAPIALPHSGSINDAATRSISTSSAALDVGKHPLRMWLSERNGECDFLGGSFAIHVSSDDDVTGLIDRLRLVESTKWKVGYFRAESRRLTERAYRAMTLLTDLEYLGVGDDVVTPEKVRALAGMHHLQRLDLSRLTPESTDEIVRGFPNLGTLLITGDFRGDVFESIAKMKRLQSLYMNFDQSKWKGSDSGIAPLSDLPLNQLVLLELELTSADRHALPSMRPLRKLNLSRCSDAIFESLGELTALRELHLDGPTLSVDRLQDYAQSHPSIAVYHGHDRLRPGN